MKLLLILLTYFSFFFLIVEGKKDKKEFKEMEYRYSLIEGIKHKYIGNLSSSLSLFFNSADLYDSSSVSNFEIANIYIMVNKLDEALKYSSKAVELNPENYWFLLQKGQILISLDKLEEAIIVYQKLITISPEKLEFRYQLAAIYIKLGQNDKAIKIYNEIENKFGIQQANSLYKYSLYIESNEYNKAKNEIDILIKQNPGEYTYYNYLANLNLLTSDTSAAIRNFNIVLENNDNDPVAISSLIQIYHYQKKHEPVIELMDRFFNNSEILENSKLNFYISLTQDINDYEKNFELIKSVLNDFTVSNTSLQSQSIYTDFLIRSKHYDDAINQLKKLINYNKANPLYWNQLINIYSLQYEYDSIIYYSDKAIALFPEDSQFYLYYGLACLQLNKLEESKNRFEQGLKLIKPDNYESSFDFFVYLGDVCYRLNNYNCSDNYFNKALEIDSNSLLVLNNYSYYLSLREENLHKALKMSYKTILSDSLNSTYLDTYAWVLYKSNDFENAKIYIEKAIFNGGSSNSEILDHYGDILLKLNYIDEAIKSWNEALKYSNHPEEIIKKIKEWEDTLQSQ